MEASCGICCEQYSQAIEPYSLPCGHSFCRSCLESLPILRCPYDKKDFKLKSISKNFSLMDILNESLIKNKELGIDLLGEDINCEKHNLQKTYFCVDHNVAICSECIIFGDHNGHEIKKIIEIKNKATKIISDKPNNFRIQDFFDFEKDMDSRKSKLQKTKDDDLMLVENEFQELIDRIIEQKQLVKSQVEDIYQIGFVYINKCMEEKKQFFDSNIELLSKKKKELEIISKSKVNNINEVIEIIQTKNSSDQEFAKFKVGLQNLERNYHLDTMLNSLSNNIREVLNNKQLFEDTFYYIKVQKLNIFEILGKSYEKFDSSKVMITDCPDKYSERELRLIAESCGEVDKFKAYSNSKDQFNGKIKINFAQKQDAIKFLLMSGFSTNKKKMNIEIKETKKKYQNEVNSSSSQFSRMKKNKMNAKEHFSDLRNNLYFD